METPLYPIFLYRTSQYSSSEIIYNSRMSYLYVIRIRCSSEIYRAQITGWIFSVLAFVTGGCSLAVLFNLLMNIFMWKQHESLEVLETSSMSYSVGKLELNQERNEEWKLHWTGLQVVHVRHSSKWVERCYTSVLECDENIPPDQ